MAMLEIEVKYTGVDFAALERQLAVFGARESPSHSETDHYFNAPDRDFALTDEALRLRRIGPCNLVTYKGPKRDLCTKTRPEIEVSLAEGDRVAADFMQLLKFLGYRPVAVVQKRRRLFHLHRQSFALAVALDEVENLGRFAELEIQAREEQNDAAQAVLWQLARDLGLTTSERRSYLELWLESRAGGTT
jgi:adenylate cyclase class 2